MTITPSAILAARPVPVADGQLDMFAADDAADWPAESESGDEGEQCPCVYAPGSWCDIHHGDNPLCDCPRAPRAWCPACQDCAACGQCDHIDTEGRTR